jgi:hypothetical protein
MPNNAKRKASNKEEANVTFVLKLASGSPYLHSSSSVVGAFDSKEEAMANAMTVLEEHSSGHLLNCMDCDEGGLDAFEDNRDNCPDNGTVLHSTDLEGSWETLSIAMTVSEPARQKASKRDPKGSAIASGDSGSSKDYSGLKLSELKDACREMGLPVSGKKAVLRQRLEAAK